MSIVEIVLLVIFLAYVVQSLLFTYASSKNYPKLSDDELPTATVIVAARNEEESIERCLRSLDALRYPEGKLEIVIADDQSDDRTNEIVSEFVKGKPRFTLLVAPDPRGNLRGKANAIDAAIERSTGEVILTTDADCVVDPDWARSTAARYVDDGVGMVFGYTGQEATDMFSGMQHLDFVYLLAVAAGAINLDGPVSCIGNNMSYRREAYRRVGGYAGLPFSVTEDFALLMAIHKTRDYRLVYPNDPGAYAVSLPCRSWSELYRQKQRWAVGGLDSPWRGFLVMTAGFLAHAALFVAPFFFTPVVAGAVAAKFVADFFMLFVTLKKLRATSTLKYFLVFEIYFILYVLALPFVALFHRNVSWKARKF
ncbi:MAG: glycosyltransferase [Ignavibacteriales bacterium]|nr:glycosyltransferase [Ignavibacteriales bacterium]